MVKALGEDVARLRSLRSATMTVTLKPNTEITVEKSVRRKAGLKVGDQVEFTVSGKVISIVPKTKRAAIADDVLSPGEAKIVRRGEAQLRRGESKPWRDLKHALAR